MSSEDDSDSFPTDYEIAQQTELARIDEVTEPFGLDADDLEFYGDHKAKVSFDSVQEIVEEEEADSDLVLVTGMTPTPQGEGKTVTTVGLGQAFNQIGEDALICIREPSLGPVFGVKGGAAGGGYSQVLPMEDINLHFTGDLHALTAAHNLISAMLDNHIRQNKEPRIDTNDVEWKRALDQNDRALRDTVVGMGDTGGQIREESFILTAASELMAVLCLADGLEDLKDRIGNIILAYDEDGDTVTVDDIEATGAATMLLKDALKPNVVQTIEGTPAFVHGGPFANIAHGTNSLIADKVAERKSDYLITEAGFGSDLGAEKFMNVVCRFGDMEPSAITLVASVRALKYHGYDMWPADFDKLDEPNPEAVEKGLENLDKHVENLQKFGVPVVVAINRFPGDTDEEIETIIDHCENDLGIKAGVSEVFAEGGEGGIDLAEKLQQSIEENDQDFEYLYDTDDSVKEKIETIATEIYGAEDVNYVDDAEEDIERIEEQGYDDMPVVMSKTFHSFSDDPSRKGAPDDWELDVRELYVSAGAGFIVVLTGDVLTMPGLPSRPAAADMDIDADGNIEGLF